MSIARLLLRWLLGLLAGLACIATALSMIHSDQGWIRILDFPRFLELIAIFVVAIGCTLVFRRWRWAIAAALVLAAGWQMSRIWSYTPIAPAEMAKAVDGPDTRSCFSLLGLNVLQQNRDYARTIAMIEREQPDILLLMETDQHWARALAPVLARYQHRVLRPLGNTYGMIFATRLPVRSARMVNITDQDTPTIYARLATRGGEPFDYVGLHPRPPRPDQDTDGRDAKLERAALAIKRGRMPAVAMGDFNDVAWSHTTRLFKRVGGFLDPRIGRGSFATFPANYAFVGWPLDQMFVTPGFTYRRIAVLENVGSDHRPLAAELCLTNPDIGTDAVSRSARMRARHAVQAIR